MLLFFFGVVHKTIYVLYWQQYSCRFCDSFVFFFFYYAVFLFYRSLFFFSCISFGLSCSPLLSFALLRSCSRLFLFLSLWFIFSAHLLLSFNPSNSLPFSPFFLFPFVIRPLFVRILPFPFVHSLPTFLSASRRPCTCVCVCVHLHIRAMLVISH